jgi:uncharacterized membrane protein YidH (DUF202 family)
VVNGNIASTMADAAPAGGGPEPPPAAGDPGAAARTGMAAERTWLAWWRTSLGASAGALAVGRFAPEVLHSSPAPYIVLGCGYALLAVGLLLVGARRQYDLQRAVERGENAPLPFVVVATFTVGGVALAIMTVVLVLAHG